MCELFVIIFIVFIIVGYSAKSRIKEHKRAEYTLQLTKLFKASVDLNTHKTLSDIFRVHKQLGEDHLVWHKDLCPNKEGMFRTDCIATMSTDEVFLGGICELWTYSLTYWLSSENEEGVAIVTSQYLGQVLHGIECEIKEIKDNLHSL